MTRNLLLLSGGAVSLLFMYKYCHYPRVSHHSRVGRYLGISAKAAFGFRQPRRCCGSSNCFASIPPLHASSPRQRGSLTSQLRPQDSPGSRPRAPLPRRRAARRCAGGTSVAVGLPMRSAAGDEVCTPWSRACLERRLPHWALANGGENTLIVTLFPVSHGCDISTLRHTAMSWCGSVISRRSGAAYGLLGRRAYR